jgi:hypothetical protein
VDIDLGVVSTFDTVILHPYPDYLPDEVSIGIHNLTGDITTVYHATNGFFFFF